MYTTLPGYLQLMGKKPHQQIVIFLFPGSYLQNDIRQLLWIGAGIAKYLEGSVQSRIQKALIPQAGTAASFINQMLMEHQDLALVQDFHLASSS